MTPHAHAPGGPAGPTLADALLAERETVVDLALLERVYLDLAALDGLAELAHR